MEGGALVMHLLRVSLLGSGPLTRDFDKKIGCKFRLLVKRVYGGGERPYSAAVGRPPWYIGAIETRGGELGY